MGKETKKEKPVLSKKLILKLEKFVNEGDNPNKIAKTDEFKTYNYHKLNSLILEHLRKVWDPNKQKYFKLCTNCNPSNFKEGLMAYSNTDISTTYSSSDDLLQKCGIDTQSLISECTKKNKSKSTNKQPEAINKKITTTPNPQYNSTISLETMSQNLDELNRKIDNIDKFIEKNNPIQKKESIEVMSKMLSSDSHKKSINLNKEIEKMILKKMEEQYGIKNNFSKSINTALFLSLYK